MLRGLTARQFAEWQMYAGMTPFGELRADWRSAQIAHMIFLANTQPGHGKTMKDFLLTFEQKEETARTPIPEGAKISHREFFEVLAAACKQKQGT